MKRFSLFLVLFVALATVALATHDEVEPSAKLMVRHSPSLLSPAPLYVPIPVLLEDQRSPFSFLSPVTPTHPSP